MPVSQARALFESADANSCFVHRNRVNRHGYVEFSFGIGSPDLMVDLVLSEQAYVEFCSTNRCIELTSEEVLAVGIEQAKWRYGKPGITE